MKITRLTEMQSAQFQSYSICFSMVKDIGERQRERQLDKEEISKEMQI